MDSPFYTLALASFLVPLHRQSKFIPKVTDLLRSFSWTHILDLGDLSSARDAEAYLLLWLRLFGAMYTGCSTSRS